MYTRYGTRSSLLTSDKPCPAGGAAEYASKGQGLRQADLCPKQTYEYSTKLLRRAMQQRSIRSKSFQDS